MVLIRRYKQKKLISKISDDSNFMFSSYARLCVFHCSHRLLCWINSRVREFSVKIALISYWNASSQIPLGACSSYRRATKICKNCAKFDNQTLNCSVGTKLISSGIFSFCTFIWYNIFKNIDLAERFLNNWTWLLFVILLF